jgi:hypothetical protein
VNPAKALGAIPTGLRTPLLAEYCDIVRNYQEGRWSPSELSAGKFCEIVFSILDGLATGKYASAPSKPKDFVSACRKLEASASVPRSFQILIPRMLPALYEVRNNRGVGHAGGDVDPNHMDATVVLSMCNWVTAELVRVFHGLSADEARALVDNLVERRVPLVWHGSEMKRVLDHRMPLKQQLLLLIASSPGKVKVDDLFSWSGYGKRPYFLRLVRKMHGERMLELASDEATVEILPPGSVEVGRIVAKRANVPSSKAS